MFAVSVYYNGHIFKEPYSTQYFLETACVNKNDQIISLNINKKKHLSLTINILYITDTMKI